MSSVRVYHPLAAVPAERAVATSPAFNAAAMAEAELDLAAQLAAALKQRDTLKSELQTAKSRAVKRITVQMERITELEKLVAAGAANGDAGAAPPGELEAALEAARQEAEAAKQEAALARRESQRLSAGGAEAEERCVRLAAEVAEAKKAAAEASAAFSAAAEASAAHEAELRKVEP